MTFLQVQRGAATFAVIGLLLATLGCSSATSPTDRTVEVANLPTAAPVKPDYKNRDALIRFWEQNVQENGPTDQISLRQLGDQYLQRYRENGSIDDVYRARRAAEYSLRAQSDNNSAAELLLVDVDLTLHRFHESLQRVHILEKQLGPIPGLTIKEASLDLEIGEYAHAKKIFDQMPARDRDDNYRIVLSRYLEENGQLAAARRQLLIAAANTNALIDIPAQRRAWFPFRLGEMAFEAGDIDTAVADENAALAIFPNYADASRALARFECAVKNWQACLEAAQRSANIIPYPETLGLEADAQQGLFQTTAAQQSQDTIYAVARIGNENRISDRLLAVEYSEHRVRVLQAYSISLRELQARDDIYTEDTIAWAAAMAGRWHVAQTAIRKAVRFNTENALLQYHAGMIALHFHDVAQARYRLQRSLQLNPRFHQVYADTARNTLAILGYRNT